MVSGRGGLRSRPEGWIHKQCRGKMARLAAAMELCKLCRAILVGFRRQLQRDGNCRDGFVGMLNSDMQKCEVLPVLQIGFRDQVFDVDVHSDKVVYRDDLAG